MHCSIKRNTQEQVIEINMCEYLTALDRYSEELLPNWYDNHDNIAGFFKSYKK